MPTCGSFYFITISLFDFYASVQVLIWAILNLFLLFKEHALLNIYFNQFQFAVQYLRMRAHCLINQIYIIVSPNVTLPECNFYFVNGHDQVSEVIIQKFFLYQHGRVHHQPYLFSRITKKYQTTDTFKYPLWRFKMCRSMHVWSQKMNGSILSSPWKFLKKKFLVKKFKNL